MNRFGFNAAEFNADSLSGTVVELGAVLVSLDLFQYEHIAFELRGNAGLEWAVFGDLTKSVQIGLAESGMLTDGSASLSQFRTITIGAALSDLALSANADITQYRAMNLGPVQSDVALAAAGMLTSIAGLGSASGGLAIVVSAALNRRLDLAGMSGVDLSASPSAGPQRTLMLGAAVGQLDSMATGDLTQYIRRDLPLAVAGLTLEGTAELTRFARVMLDPVLLDIGMDTAATLQMRVNSMPVSAELTLTETGTVVNRVAMQGNSALNLASSGQLFNNPMAPDVPAMVLIRPFTDRLMVRQ